MSNLDKVIDAINIPKRIVEGTESFLRKLLGPAITEGGQLIADEIRYRRFKNQVTIFNKAKSLLEEKSIDVKQINLKILAPLIEYSSLEEDEKVQNTWANVIANIATFDTEQSFNLKCIEILKEITPSEIYLIDYLYERFKEEEVKTLESWKERKWFQHRTSVYPENSVFAPWELRDKLSISDENIYLYIDRLISFGILKHEQPELNESTSEQRIIDTFSAMDNIIEVKSYELSTSERVHFTNFGLYFVRLCKYEK